MKVGLIGNEYSVTSIEADVELPETIEKGIEIIKKRDSEKDYTNVARNDVPWMIFDVLQSHGPDDTGLIYLSEYSEKFGSIDHNTREKVRIRLSFGMSRPYKDKEVSEIFSLKNCTRMHIGVEGERGFYCEDHFDKFYPNKKITALDCCNEQINFSLRWLNKGEGFEFLNHSIENCIFNHDRTTYGTWHPPGGGICLDEEKIKKYIENVPKRERLLEKVVGPSPKNVISVYRGITHGIFDYEDVLKFLSDFGNVNPNDASKFSKMNFNEGIEYLLGNILPAIEKFVAT